MKLTSHVILKDLRRYRPLLALWFALFALRIFFCSRIMEPAGWEPSRFTGQLMSIGGMTLLIGLINYLLVCAFMLEDPVTGSRMFWATRPIAGGRLLRAKAWAIAIVFLLWPLLVNLIWGLTAGIALIDLLPSLGRTLFFHATITVLAMGLAALSGTVSRVFVWSLLAIVAIPIVAGTIPPLVSRDVKEARLVVVLILLALGSVGAIGWLFLARRLTAAATWALASIALALGAAFFWRWSFVPPPTQPSGDGPRFEVRRIEIQSKMENAVVDLALVIKDVPADFVMRRGVLRAELMWPDGDTTTATGSMEIWPSSETRISETLGLARQPSVEAEMEAHAQEMRRREENRASRFAVRLDKWIGPSDVVETEHTTNAFFTLSLEDAARLAEHAPRCRVWLESEKLRPELIGEVPLRSGSHLSAQGFHLTVQKITDRRHPRTDELTSRSCAFTFSEPAVSSGQILELRVVDRPRGRLWWSPRYERSSPLPVAWGLPSTYVLSGMDLPVPQAWQTDRLVDRPERYEDFTVAAIAMRPAGKWVQLIEIERLAPTPRH